MTVIHAQIEQSPFTKQVALNAIATAANNCNSSVNKLNLNICDTIADKTDTTSSTFP
jgi:hypothetical protein